MKKLPILLAAAMLTLVSCERNVEDRTLSFIEQSQYIFDKERVMDYFQKAKQGDAYSEWQVSVLLRMMGQSGDAPFEDVLRLCSIWTTRAALHGCPYAMINLGDVDEPDADASVTDDMVEEFHKQGFKLLIEKAEPDARDCNFLSHCYLNGVGTDVDVDKARMYYRRSLEILKCPSDEIERRMKNWEDNLHHISPHDS